MSTSTITCPSCGSRMTVRLKDNRSGGCNCVCGESLGYNGDYITTSASRLKNKIFSFTEDAKKHLGIDDKYISVSLEDMDFQRGILFFSVINIQALGINTDNASSSFNFENHIEFDKTRAMKIFASRFSSNNKEDKVKFLSEIFVGAICKTISNLPPHWINSKKLNRIKIGLGKELSSMSVVKDTIWMLKKKIKAQEVLDSTRASRYASAATGHVSSGTEHTHQYVQFTN